VAIELWVGGGAGEDDLPDTMALQQPYKTVQVSQWELVQVVPVECGVNLRDLLSEIVARRMDVDAIFDRPETLRQLVVACGGVVRDLMRLIRFACDYATGERIDEAAARRAIARMVREYERLIHREDLELLAQVHRERHLPGSSALSRLMYNRLVLPYVNGERWMDVHPAVVSAPLFRDYFRLERG